MVAAQSCQTWSLHKAAKHGHDSCSEYNCLIQSQGEFFQMLNVTSLVNVINILTICDIIMQQTCKPSPMWDCASSHDLLNYYTKSGSLLSDIDVPHAALSCTSPNCHDQAHQPLLCKCYDDIINSLMDASDIIPTKTHSKSQKFNVPGWNDLVRDSHQAARETFLV